jgi:methyl-accepting chemotaxis protein
MRKKIAAFLLSRYEARGGIEKKQVRSLFIVLFSLIAIAVLAAIVVTTPFIKIALAALALVMAGLVLLARSGRAGAAAVSSSVLIAAAFSLILALRDYSDPYEMFYLSFIIAFDITVASFISSKAWLPLVVMGIGTAGVAYMYAGRVLPHLAAAAAQDLYVDDFIVSLILGWANALIGLASMRRSFSLLKAAESESEQNLSRIVALRAAIEASSESLKIGSDLTGSSRKSSALLEGALEGLSSAAADMKGLSGGTGVLKSTLAEILESSKASYRSAEEQGSVVSQTSAAIEEMTASIKNVSKVTEARREAVKRLDESTAQGREDMLASTEAVKRMETHAESILEVVKVISSVASRTNLLAMNAAIEAAHAGEYGRGFSVVADEIRKLSEQTGKNVKAISSTIKETIAAIEGVSAGNERSVQRYGRISEDAELLSDAMEEVIRGLMEISGGTEEITSGVQASVRSTQDLKAATAKVDEEIRAAERALGGLDESSRSILEDLRGMKERTEEALAEAKRVMEIGARNEEGIKRLGSMLETA